MFVGESRHNMDDKGRVVIPSKFRDELGENFCVTIGLDGCLSVYTMEQWKEIAQRAVTLPETKREARQYVRMLASKAVTCSCDKQGRIQLPNYLITAAKIEKECTIVGAFDHAEIWASEKWDDYSNLAEESFEEVAEQLTDLLR